MGTKRKQARAAAQAVWKSEIGEQWRKIGGARCDMNSSHIIAPGDGCLCRPRRLGDTTPDLVCERCFDSLPYEGLEIDSNEGMQLVAQLLLRSMAIQAREGVTVIAVVFFCAALLSVAGLTLAGVCKSLCWLTGWNWMGWFGWWTAVCLAVAAIVSFFLAKLLDH